MWIAVAVLGLAGVLALLGVCSLARAYQRQADDEHY